MDRGATAEIDLKAISHNCNGIKKITGNKKIIAVVKADAYGHGAAEISKRLVKEGVSYLAVAYTSEAISLRASGIKAPVIVLFDKEDPGLFFKYNLIPVLHDLKTAGLFSKEAKKRRQKINVHMKIDTGMGRLGFNNNIEKDVDSILKTDAINITGLMSHFSDADLAERSFALMQIERFNNVRAMLIKKTSSLLCHMSNSAAALSLPQAHFDAVRPGLMLYGYSPLQKSEVNLRPAMTIKTKILSLRKVKKGIPISYGRTFITMRDSLIAVLPVGYADGYSRAFSNKADVLIRGRRAPVSGRVCMDTIMVDATDIRGVTEGDDAVLLGRQRTEFIGASELAEKAGTISYEILTSLGNRSKRIYKN